MNMESKYEVMLEERRRALMLMLALGEELDANVALKEKSY